MKRIEFIAPVESMRGNLSGAQKLEYPTDNQGAYEGPMGSVNYARNYSPRFVGAKIAKSGRMYFAVRLRSANHLTAKSKKAMALLGGTGAIYAAILKNASLLAGIQAQYAAIQELGETRSFRKYVTDTVRRGLILRNPNFTFAGPATPVVVNNPWNAGTATPNVQISNAILVKFWSELALDPITFTINGQVGVAHVGDEWDVIISTNYNVLNLAFIGSGSNYVGMGGAYVISADDTYQESGMAVESGASFTTTSAEPA